MADGNLKRCSRCRQELPASAFNKATGSPSGLRCQCRECESIRSRERRQADPTKFRESYEKWRRANPAYHATRNRKWAENNRDKIASQNERYRAENRETLRIQKLAYCEANRERESARARAWAKANPEKRRIQEARREARKLSLPDTWTIEQARAGLGHWGEACAACRVPLGLVTPCHWDHWIPLVAPGCPGTVAKNMVPLCERCNCSKSDRPAESWTRDTFAPHGAKTFAAIEAYLAAQP